MSTKVILQMNEEKKVDVIYLGSYILKLGSLPA